MTKRIISGTAALLLSASSVQFLSSSAAEGMAQDKPTCYFRINETEDITFDGEVYTIDRSSFNSEGYKIPVEVYYYDPANSSWDVNPKWKCANHFLKLADLTNPQNPFIPYAFAEVNEEGAFVKNLATIMTSIDEEYNTMAFKCYNASLANRSPFTSYGEETDSYMLTSFNAVFSPSSPYGEYEIYFLTESEDYEDQRYSTAARTIDGERTVVVPYVESIKIRLTGFILGDVNNDGAIDASDASDTLKEYASLSVGNSRSFDENQMKAGDIDENGSIDASDASSILRYYAYLSTTENALPFSEFLAE